MISSTESWGWEGVLHVVMPGIKPPEFRVHPVPLLYDQTKANSDPCVLILHLILFLRFLLSVSHMRTTELLKSSRRNILARQMIVTISVRREFNRN